MRLKFVVVAAIALLWLTTGSAEAAQPRPIQGLGWLVGGVWVATASSQDRSRVETRYEWAPNGAFIRFSTTFVNKGRSFVNYSGNFFAASAEPDAKLSMWYMDAHNEIVSGPVILAGSGWSSTFSDSGSNYRVQITRKTHDLYHWALSKEVGTSWKPQFGLDFVRQK